MRTGISIEVSPVDRRDEAEIVLRGDGGAPEMRRHISAHDGWDPSAPA
jgi:hypothetical protein